MSGWGITVRDEQLQVDIGRLEVFKTGRRGSTYRFESWLKGLESSPTGTELPAFLSDAMPDSWGARLIKRSLKLAREPHPHELLLGVADSQRTGALRFIDEQTGEALAVSGEVEIPPIVDLGLIDSEVKKVTGDPEYRVSELIGIGSQSLGGARPKVTVRDKNGDLWVAKFAALNDIPQLEVSVMNAASECGIACAETRYTSVGNSGVVLSKRFDRSRDDCGQYLRIGMRSYAAELLVSDAGVGLDWADLASVTDSRDLVQLWRRAVFGVLVGNTDDHVRNHSQLRAWEGGSWVWRLSPAYDITQQSLGDASHALSVLGEHSAVNIADALPAFAEWLGLENNAAKYWLRQTLSVLSRRRILTVDGAQESLQRWAES